MADSGQQQAIASAKPAKLPKLATLTLAEALQQLAAYQDEMEATQGPVSPEHNARVVCKLRRLMLRTHLVGARDLRAGKRRLRQVDKLHKEVLGVPCPLVAQQRAAYKAIEEGHTATFGYPFKFPYKIPPHLTVQCTQEDHENEDAEMDVDKNAEPNNSEVMDSQATQ